MDGFSERLLPSDRWQWSDVTGLVHQPLDGFGLPSSGWEWETDWYADENFEAEPTEKGVSSQGLLSVCPSPSVAQGVAFFAASGSLVSFGSLLR